MKLYSEDDNFSKSLRLNIKHKFLIHTTHTEDTLALFYVFWQMNPQGLVQGPVATPHRFGKAASRSWRVLYTPLAVRAFVPDKSPFVTSFIFPSLGFFIRFFAHGSTTLV